MANATRRLETFCGQTVHFFTAVSVLCDEMAFHFERTVDTAVHFRNLLIMHRYVEMDNPIDCAGSFKCGAAGVGLLRNR